MGTRSGLRRYAAAVAAAVALLGVTAYVGTATGDDANGHARSTAEPLAVAAENVYRALSDADATAAMVFLSGAQAQTTGVDRYDRDISQASTSLAAIGGQPGDAQVLPQAVSRLVADLPLYTGLVGTAQADARQDLPVGAAYLREASALMRTELLPNAQAVLQGTTTRLTSDAASSRGSRFALVVAGVAFVVLVPAQLFVARRTRRRFNIGLVTATVLVAVVAVWAVAASTGATGATDDARAHRQSADALITTELAVLQAHGDELLSLAARGEDVGTYEKDFTTVSAHLGALLAADQGSGITDARAGYRDWMADHGALAQSASSPQPDNKANVQALAQATGTQPGTGTLFARIDGDVVGAVSVQEAAYRKAIDAAGSDLRGLAGGSAVLMVVAFAAGVFGMNQRLREYR